MIYHVDNSDGEDIKVLRRINYIKSLAMIKLVFSDTVFNIEGMDFEHYEKLKEIMLAKVPLILTGNEKDIEEYVHGIGKINREILDYFVMGD